MSPDDFLHHLHADSYESRPPDWEVDWEDAPLKYKLYRGLPSIPLSSEVPMALEERPSTPTTDLTEIGHFLWYAFGLSQLSQSYSAGSSTDPLSGALQTYRRFVPSGGGLYPNEIYIYLKTKEIPAGVYHYDTAHHRLVLLREGDFESYLARALGNRCETPSCFGVVIVTAMFWKNFFKYNNFAYRLQGLDTGVLIGQMLEVANRFGYATGVYFQFLDRALGHLLGLSNREESVYAVIPLSTKPAKSWFVGAQDDIGDVNAADLCKELPAVRHDHYVRSRRVRDYSMLLKVNEAAMLDSSASFRQAGASNSVENGLQAAYLPRVNRLSYDLASICRKRYSPETDFVLGKVTQTQLAALLQEVTASFSYCNDMDGPYDMPKPRVSLYGCLYNVEGVQDGAYRYDSASHALQRVRPGDHRLRLQQGMSLHNVNLFQVPLCFHVAGDKHHLMPALGYRGYRIQQMETGMLVQRLLLAASALGMGGRPLLGFHVRNMDDMYRLDFHGKTSLIQIPIGPYRNRPALDGGLHS